MSIEQQLSELTAAVKALTTAITAASLPNKQPDSPPYEPKTTTVKPKPKAEPAPEAAAPATGGGTTLSPEQVSDASELIKQANPLISELVANGKREEAAGLLAKYSAKKTSGVPPEKLPSFLGELKALHKAALGAAEEEDALV